MTKKVWTLSEAKELIQEEMDTQSETFVSSDELVNYFNEAIDECEAEIHNLYQDYFLTSSPIPLTQGISSYDLPSDIYANKIRFIQYKKSQNEFYEIKRVPLKRIMLIDETLTNVDYVYHLENSLTGGQKIVFHPTPWDTDATSVTLWYIRNAARVEDDDDVIDIPEFISFIFAYVKVKIARKEVHPMLAVYIQEMDYQRSLMKTTLDRMVPDEDLTIHPDLSFYDDFDIDVYC